MKTLTQCVSLLKKLLNRSERVTPEILNELFSPYLEDDPQLEDHIDHFPFDEYQVVKSSGGRLFYLDNSPDWIKNKFAKRGTVYESHVVAEMGRYALPGSIAIDVGGHIGTHTLTLSRLVSPEGWVYVFEPQVKIFAELVINLYLNGVENVIPHRKAIGGTQKTVHLTKADPRNEGHVGIGEEGDSVPMTTLDNFALTNISFMKVDVEGNEMAVLEGAHQTLLNNRPTMVIEIMGGVPYATANEAQKAIIHERIASIKELGYTVTHIGVHEFLCIPKMVMA